MADAGIVRNRAKIESAIKSARVYLEIEAAQGFSNYIWGFVDGRPVQNKLKHMGQMPTESVMSIRLSKDLKKRGFNFCGPTIVYAFAQAVGMVNDHLVDCHRHAECAALAGKRPA
jgi:DNA-3-methyladenine glycosylase I